MAPHPVSIPLETASRNPRFALFDGLRAIAVAFIFVFHIGVIGGYNVDGTLGRVTSRLDAGVALFFVITGFLLYRPFVAARAHAGPPARLRDYAAGRLLRIVPAYWVALLIMQPTGLIRSFDGRDWRLFALVQNYGTGLWSHGIGPAWSLAVEASFYLLLPAWAYLAARRRPRVRNEAALLLLLGVATVAARTQIWDTADYRLFQSLPVFLDWFVLGMLLALLSVSLQRAPARPRAVARLDARPWLPWAGAALAFGATCALPLPRALVVPRTSLSVAQHVLYGLVAALLVLPAVLDPGGERRSVVTRVLGAGVMRRLGTISYGVFLWNWPLLLCVALKWRLEDRGPLGPSLTLALIGGTLTLAAALASYALIEAPALRAKAALRRHTARRSAAPPTTAPVA